MILPVATTKIKASLRKTIGAVDGANAGSGACKERCTFGG